MAAEPKESAASTPAPPPKPATDAPSEKPTAFQEGTSLDAEVDALLAESTPKPAEELGKEAQSGTPSPAEKAPAPPPPPITEVSKGPAPLEKPPAEEPPAEKPPAEKPPTDEEDPATDFTDAQGNAYRKSEVAEFVKIGRNARDYRVAAEKMNRASRVVGRERDQYKALAERLQRETAIERQDRELASLDPGKAPKLVADPPYSLYESDPAAYDEQHKAYVASVTARNAWEDKHEVFAAKEAELLSAEPEKGDGDRATDVLTTAEQGSLAVETWFADDRMAEARPHRAQIATRAQEIVTEVLAAEKLGTGRDADVTRAMIGGALEQAKDEIMSAAVEARHQEQLARASAHGEEVIKEQISRAEVAPGSVKLAPAPVAGPKPRTMTEWIEAIAKGEATDEEYATALEQSEFSTDPAEKKALLAV